MKLINTEEYEELLVLRDAMRYLYGDNSGIDWRAVVDEKLIPPLPLPKHTKYWNLS